MSLLTARLSCSTPFVRVKMSLMATTIKIGQAGRIVLPKAVRDELRLNPGDCLRLECSEGALFCVPCEQRTDLQEAGSLGYEFGRTA